MALTINAMSSSRKAISSEVPNNHILGLLYHLHTVYLFSRDNIKDIICIGFVFGTLNSLVAPLFSMCPPLSFNRVPFASYKMLLWSWSNLFLFNLHNQRHPSSISEDALNKPWRPIPAGRITSAQATPAAHDTAFPAYVPPWKSTQRPRMKSQTLV